MSYVRFLVCGKFFEVQGMAFSNKRKKRAFFVWRIYISRTGG